MKGGVAGSSSPSSTLKKKIAIRILHPKEDFIIKRAPRSPKVGLLNCENSDGWLFEDQLF